VSFSPAPRDVAEQIIRLSLAGSSKADIQRQTNFPADVIERVVAQYHTDLTMAVQEVAEMVTVKNVARAEYLLSRIWPYAVGEFPNEEVKSRMPSIHFIGEVRKLIELEEKIAARVQENTQKMRDRSEDMANIGPIEQTFLSSNPLYLEALKTMQEDWLSAADDPIDAIYGPAESPLSDEFLDPRLQTLAEAESTIPEGERIIMSDYVGEEI